MKKKIRTLKHKLSAYISALVRVFLASTFFCAIGVMSSVLAEDLPNAKGPFFYKADKEGKSLYLLGTLHFDSLDQLQCQAPIMSFLEDSDLLFTESSLEVPELVTNELMLDALKSSDYEFNKLNEDNKNVLVEKFKDLSGNVYDDSDEQYIEALRSFNSSIIASWIGALCILSDSNVGTKLSSVKMDLEIQQIAENLNIPQDFLDDIEVIKDLTVFLNPFLNYSLTTENIDLIIDDHDWFCKNMIDDILPLHQNKLY